MNAILLNHTVTSIACQPFTEHLNGAVVLWHRSRHRIELGDNAVDASSNAGTLWYGHATIVAIPSSRQPAK